MGWERRLKQRLIYAPEGRPRVDPDAVPQRSIRRVLVVRQHDQLGDFIIATPALRALRERFPESHITLVCRNMTRDVAVGNPHVDRVMVFPQALADWVRGGAADVCSVARRPFGPGWDLAVVLNTVSRSFTSDWLAHASGARFILGPQSPRPRDWSGPEDRDPVYNLVSPVRESSVHMADRNLDIVRHIGAQPHGRHYDVPVPDSARDWAEAELARRGVDSRRPVVGVHLGTKDPVKQYPVDRFAALADGVAERFRATVLALAAPETGPAMAEFIAAVRHPVEVMPLGRLSALAALLARCDVVICNDSGILHMAAGVGTPTVSFHSRGHPRVWKPAGDRHIALYAATGRIEDITLDEARVAVASLMHTTAWVGS